MWPSLTTKFDYLINAIPLDNVALILLLILLYNLELLSFVEQTPYYATLRVLGTHRNEIRNLTLIENLITIKSS